MLNIKRVESEDDRELLVSKAEEIWLEHFTSIIGEEQVRYMLAKFLSYDAIMKQEETQGYEYYLLYDEKDICGFTAIVQEKERMFLSKLYVQKSCRGKRYSSKTLHFIEKQAVKRGLSSIWLTCNKYNKTTLDIYHHLGFEIFDSAVNDIGNGYVMDDYYLEKRLVDIN